MGKRREDETNNMDAILMQITKQGGLGNTTIIGQVTIRTAFTLVVVIAVGIILLKSPLFSKNWPAIIAYVALCNILLGRTPTGRNILTNIYGIVFKKPANMLVHDEMTLNTIGHGIKEVEYIDSNLDAVPFRMVGTKNYALVYNITSGIGYWSSEADKVNQARAIKSLYNILEGGESLMIVEKEDNDTGMLALKSYLESQEQIDSEDLQQMANRRSGLLYNVGTMNKGRTIQQYAILMVKPKNVNRTANALKKASRLIRPATNPADILFTVMGFEGGVEYCRTKNENKEV